MKWDELAEKLQSVYDHQDPENLYPLFLSLTSDAVGQPHLGGVYREEMGAVPLRVQDWPGVVVPRFLGIMQP